MKSCNFNVSCNENISLCSSCQHGKGHKLPFKPSNAKATKPLEIIHSDLWGLAPLNSRQ